MHMTVDQAWQQRKASAIDLGCSTRDREVSIDPTAAIVAPRTTTVARSIVRPVPSMTRIERMAMDFIMVYPRKGLSYSPSHRRFCRRSLVIRNRVRLHMISQRQGEEQVCDHGDKGKGPESEHPE